MNSNTSIPTHNRKITKQERSPSFNPLLPSLQKIWIDKILNSPNLYNCFPSNSSNLNQIQRNASIKNTKREGFSKIEVGKNEIHTKIAQIKEISQETTFLDNIVSEKGQGNQQCQTTSISSNISQEEAHGVRQRNQEPSYLLPVFQIPQFDIELFKNEQQKGSQPLSKRKNKGSKKIDNEREAKLKEVEDLLLIYNLQNIERNPKQKVDISKYHKKAIRFLYRLSKKSLKRDESIKLAFSQGQRMKTMTDFHKILEILKDRLICCSTN